MAIANTQITKSSVPKRSKNGRRGGRRDQHKNAGLAWALLSPLFVVLLLVLALPAAFAFYYSFMQLSFVRPVGWGGAQNWIDAISGYDLGAVVPQTVVFIIGASALTLLVAIPVAVGLARVSEKLSILLQVVVIFPWVMSAIVSALLFRLTFLENIGLVQYVLSLFGIHENLLNSPVGAMFGMIVTASWRTIGFAVLLLLSGIKTIDPSLYEAARIDGANRWQEFRFITLAGIRLQLAIAVVILVVSNLNNLEVPLGVTGGGPGSSTTTLALLIYNTAFTDFKFGPSVAMSAMAIFVTIILVVLYARLTSRDND